MTMYPKNPPSDRLYEQMLMWGWKTRTSGRTGDKDLMYFKPADFSIEVNAPDNPDHNKLSVVKTVIKVTTGGDARRFWDRSVMVGIGWLRDETTRREQEVIDQDNDPAGIDKPSSAAAHLQTPEAIAKAKANRGMTELVLAWLEKQDEPVNQAMIVDALGIDVKSARNAVFLLRKNGRVVTPGVRGWYQTPKSITRAKRRRKTSEKLAGITETLERGAKSLRESTAATKRATERIAPKAQKLPSNRRGQRIVDMSAPLDIDALGDDKKARRPFVHNQRQHGKTQTLSDLGARLSDLGDDVRTWPVMTMTADEARRRKIEIADDWATVEEEKQRLLDESEQRTPSDEDRIEAALHALLPGGFDARALFDPQRNEALQVFVGACKQVLATYQEPSVFQTLGHALFGPGYSAKS